MELLAGALMKGCAVAAAFALGWFGYANFGIEQKAVGSSSAAAGAVERFRAVLMTALTFVLGILPLVWATGAGAGSRRAIGTATFAGMLVATLVGLVLVPGLYVLFQTLREKVRGRD